MSDVYVMMDLAYLFNWVVLVISMHGEGNVPGITRRISKEAATMNTLPDALQGLLNLFLLFSDSWCPIPSFYPLMN